MAKTFPTRLKKELEERSAREPEHEGCQLYRKRPTAEEELQGISAKNQKIYDERLAARQVATERNAEDRRAARTAEPCLCTKEGATERLRQTQDMLHDSMQQTREAQQDTAGREGGIEIDQHARPVAQGWQPVGVSTAACAT